MPVEDKQMKKQAELESAFTFCDSAETGEVSISNLIAHIGKSRNYVKDLIDANPKYERDRKGMVRKVSKCQKDVYKRQPIRLPLSLYLYNNLKS